MSIIAHKITRAGNALFRTQATTLDEITRELPRGFYTTFSTLVQGSRVFGLHLHLQRLYIPAMEHGIRPSADETTLRSAVAELTKTNLPYESRVRLILTKNDGSIYVAIQAFEPLPSQIYDDGVKVVTAELARHFPRVKDTGFIAESMEQRKVIHRGIFEVLLTKKGDILEGMTSNFYVVTGSVLITAQHGILLGVTRRIILRLARGQGMSIEYRAPKIGEKFDEAFLTSSSRGVVPIVSIDNKSVGQGSVGKWVKILSKTYKNYIEEKSEKLIE